MVDVDRMRADLLTARKARDKVTEVALKRALAAFENAEAPPAPDKANLHSVGPMEVPRVVLSDDDRVRILRAELDEAALAANQYEDGGRAEAAEKLRAESAVLERYLGSR